MNSSYTFPSTTPTSVAEAKAAAHVDGTGDDAYFGILVSAAARYFEKETTFALINRIVTSVLPYWPRSRAIHLPHPPLSSLTSIVYTLAATGPTLADTNYVVDIASWPGRAILKNGVEWPTDELHPPGITLTYVAGFGAAGSNVPDDIRSCLLQITTSWYENREAVYIPDSSRAGVPTVVPMGAQRIIDDYKGRIF